MQSLILIQDFVVAFSDMVIRVAFILLKLKIKYLSMSEWNIVLCQSKENPKWETSFDDALGETCQNRTLNKPESCWNGT
jgi:hypothetical protein